MNSRENVVKRLLLTPILQAPMAGVSTPELAAAVSNAGAIGAIGIGASSTSQAQQMIRETKARTQEPFHVNVFCHQPATADHAREQAWLKFLAPLFTEHGGEAPSELREIYKSFLEADDAFEMLLAERPAVVSFHFGLPSPGRIKALQNAGIFTLASATSLADARLIERAGVDAIVAQGIEAGGHRGLFEPDAEDEELPTSVLVRLLVKSTSLPVIAAGGIMDGQGIKAAMDLGAIAAQMGTAFILCPESSASASYRSILSSERAGHTRLTSAISGRPARGIVNRYFTYAGGINSPRPAAYPMAYDAAKQLNALAAKSNNHEFAAHWAGQGAPLARELTAAKLVETLMQELHG